MKAPKGNYRGCRKTIENNWLPFKRTANVIRDDGDEQLQVLYYLDYKPVHGVLIPHYIEREDVQHVREQVIDQVEINPHLQEGLFHPQISSSD